MNFFNNVTNIDELKKQFKRLIMKHHPDRGGDTATCQAINAEYDLIMERLINEDDDSFYTPNENGYSFWENRQERNEVEKKVREAIEKIIMLDGINIEVVGVWVWVDGETKKHKEALKDAGYRWFKNKKKWAFASKKSKGRGKMSMNEVRERYGSQSVKKDKEDTGRKKLEVA